MTARVRERQTWYAAVAQDADPVSGDLPILLALGFAAVTAAQLAVIALAPSLFSLLVVFVIYLAAITAMLFVESWRGRRSRSTPAGVVPMPAERLEHQTPGAEEYRRAA
jgi:hypothetical protein